MGNNNNRKKDKRGTNKTMTFHTVQLKKRTFILIPTAKDEFIDHHPEWDKSMISNDKIVYEALRYYIGTGRYKHIIENLRKDK